MSDQTFHRYSVEDLRTIAKRRLPIGMFEFMDRCNDDEIDRVMASLGVNSVAELDRSHVAMPRVSPIAF